MTPEQDAVLRDIQAQLASARHGIDQLAAESTALRGQIDELRKEIGDLETTAAELADRLRQLRGGRLPWPLSLLEEPAALVASRLTALLSDLPGLPGPQRLATVENESIPHDKADA
ncbi:MULTISPECIES: hypothetical protein [unclassified Nocardia]|uniref:hypothetical protein n=1 Tax=unclassified Nocardia TaxID=2637762 RepID=UPI001CE43279|nr:MULTISPECIES: hypothetical protein [unclassified Nocardia]